MSKNLAKQMFAKSASVHIAMSKNQVAELAFGLVLISLEMLKQWPIVLLGIIDNAPHRKID